MASDKMRDAVKLEEKAIALEAQGQKVAAEQEYMKSLRTFEFIYKYENNPKVKEMVGERLKVLLDKVEALRQELKNPAPTPAAAGGPAVHHGSGYGGAQAPAAPGHQEPEEDKEKAALRKNLEGAIMTSKPDIKWDDVAGLQGAKDALQETVILPTTFPQLFLGKREPWHGILLYGPPGTGKSFLAKACATEAEATFFSISSSDLVSKWMGESERLVRQLFEMARESKPSIIFIDEVDSLCGARGESGESDAARRIKTEFLAQMDGVGKSKAQLLVLGATNTPWDLDTAIRRRFEKRVYIPLPEEEARVVMLRLNLGTTPSDCTEEELRHVAKRADGFSGADMSILVRDALFEPVRRCQRAKCFHRVEKAGEDGVMKQYWTPCSPGVDGAVEMSLMQVPRQELLPPVVSATDFEAALEKVRPSVSPGDLKKYVDWTAQFGTEAD